MAVVLNEGTSSLFRPLSKRPSKITRFPQNQLRSPLSAARLLTSGAGGIIQCSRAIALVYYLTPDWKPGFGGAFVDIQGGGAAHPPRFNTAVAFRIPRWHEVAPVLGPEPRHSVFGWFLTPGRLYELDDAVQGLDDESLPPQRCKLGRRLLGLAGVEDGVDGDVDGDVADANGDMAADQGA